MGRGHMEEQEALDAAQRALGSIRGPRSEGEFWVTL